MSYWGAGWDGDTGGGGHPVRVTNEQDELSAQELAAGALRFAAQESELEAALGEGL